MVQNNATGITTYTDEDGNTSTSNAVSADVGNDLIVGADGGAYVNIPAVPGETTTTLTQNDATGIATYTSEDATVTTIDVVSSDAGNTITVGADGGAYAAVAGETTTTLVDNTDGTFTYTSEDGTVTTFDADGDLVDNGDGSFTYTNAAGVAVTYNEVTTSLAQNAGTGVITYTDEDGATATANVRSTDANNDIIIGADGGAYYNAPASPGETTTTMVDNGNGTHTYTSEDATATIFNTTDDQNIANLGLVGTTLTVGIEDGTSQVVNLGALVGTDDQNISGSSFNGVTNELTIGIENGTNETVDLSALAGGVETTTTLVDNTDGSFTYTSEDATVTTWTESLTTMMQNDATGVATYTDEDGNTTTLDVISTDANNDIIVGVDGGAYLNIPASPGETTTTLIQNDATGVATYTSENATVTTIDVISTDAANTLTVGADGGAYLAAGTSANTIYTTDDSLTGDRVVTQGTNDLTFSSSGTAKTVVDGTMQFTGALYGSIRSHALASNIVWTSTDFAVVITNLGITNNLLLPDPTLNAGRMLAIRNNAGGPVQFAAGTGAPVNMGFIAGGSGYTFMSDGTNWHPIGSR
ncbi:MAG: hypothetical protein DRQ56_10375 [Gammaproteobacteria bacterium]|nr:MAG: hypothetical protein DRQ56_10375 [Gammaproteobacteria bacterium]